MNALTDLAKLRDHIVWLTSWQATLEQNIANAQGELEVVQGLRMSAMQAREALLSRWASGTGRRITIDDIKHCKTQREALRLVAELNGGPAHLGDVAELVVEARMTKSDKDSVRSSLYHYVTDNPDIWAHLGNSRVWLLEFGPVPDAAHAEDEEAEEQTGPVDGLSCNAGSTDSVLAGQPAQAPVSG